jgi:hypothetical protein
LADEQNKACCDYNNLKKSYKIFGYFLDARHDKVESKLEKKIYSIFPLCKESIIYNWGSS